MVRECELSKYADAMSRGRDWKIATRSMEPCRAHLKMMHAARAKGAVAKLHVNGVDAAGRVLRQW